MAPMRQQTLAAGLAPFASRHIRGTTRRSGSAVAQMVARRGKAVALALPTPDKRARHKSPPGPCRDGRDASAATAHVLAATDDRTDGNDRAADTRPQARHPPPKHAAE
jgi:hypothetical protein